MSAPVILALVLTATSADVRTILPPDRGSRPGTACRDLTVLECELAKAANEAEEKRALWESAYGECRDVLKVERVAKEAAQDQARALAGAAPAPAEGVPLPWVVAITGAALVVGAAAGVAVVLSARAD